MYRICGVATFLIGMIASIQDPKDYANYSPLKAVNFYSITLPMFVLLYDSQIPKLLSRQEHRMPKVSKYTYVSVYWILMILSACFYLHDPKMDVMVMKEVFLEEDEVYKGEGSLEEGKVPKQIENED